MNIETYKHVQTFWDILSKPGIHRADYRNVRTTYYCGPQALDRYREQCGGELFKLFAEDVYPAFWCSRDASQILSIGRSRSHDQSRRFASETGHPYSTCPLPMSNDCFATDRWGGSFSRAAAQLGFPSVIILDWSLCASVGLDPNKYGLGGVRGLVASIRDFRSCSESHAVAGFVPDVDAMVDRLFDCWSNPRETPESKIAVLGASLCMKGLLIGLAGTNDVVAGCDHLIGYKLKSKGIKWSHGSLVAAGVLMTLPIFPDVPVEMVLKLARFSLSAGLLTTENLRFLEHVGIADILRDAPITRPKRKTLLRHLTHQDEERVKVSVRRVISENE